MKWLQALLGSSTQFDLSTLILPSGPLSLLLSPVTSEQLVCKIMGQRKNRSVSHPTILHPVELVEQQDAVKAGLDILLGMSVGGENFQVPWEEALLVYGSACGARHPCPFGMCCPLRDTRLSEVHLRLRDQGSTLFCSQERKVWGNAVNPTQWLQNPIELRRILSVYFSLSSSVDGIFAANLIISSSA